MRRRSLILALLVLAACESPVDRRRAEADADGFIAKWKAKSADNGLGREAKAFALPVIGAPGLSGETLGLEDLAGSVVVLNFWSTWCAPCREEHEDLNRLAEAYAEKGVRFVGIVSDPPRALLAAETKDGLRTSYPNLYDEGDRVQREYRIYGWPQHLVIDRDGRIVFDLPGGPIDPEAFAEVLDRVLAGAGTAAGALYQEHRSANGRERLEEMLRARGIKLEDEAQTSPAR